MPESDTIHALFTTLDDIIHARRDNMYSTTQTTRTLHKNTTTINICQLNYT